MYKPEDILIERERRIVYQEKLTREYKMPILVIRVNYPGIEKDNNLSKEITKIMEQEISQALSTFIKYKRKSTTAEGPIVTMCISMVAEDIKALTINLENNHLLGRCVDIDVYDETGQNISRQELGFPMRKCYVCDDIAHNCVRSKKHCKEEVVGYIQNKYKEYMEKINEK